jgi:hypothetical protein
MYHPGPSVPPSQIARGDPGLFEYCALVNIDQYRNGRLRKTIPMPTVYPAAFTERPKRSTTFTSDPALA